MSTSTIVAAGALLVVLFFIYRILASASAKKAERDKSEQAQIMRLFKPGDKLTGAQVGERLEERTGKRRAFYVYHHLNTLVAREELVVSNTKVRAGGNNIDKIEYSLPK